MCGHPGRWLQELAGTSRDICSLCSLSSFVPVGGFGNASLGMANISSGNSGYMLSVKAYEEDSGMG